MVDPGGVIFQKAIILTYLWCYLEYPSSARHLEGKMWGAGALFRILLLIVGWLRSNIRLRRPLGAGNGLFL